MFLFILSGLIACAGRPVSCSCPIAISPVRAAVRFGDPFRASCTSLTDLVDGMGWESTEGGVGLTNTSFLPLNINSVKHWTLNPSCFINYNKSKQCLQSLSVSVYKMPDSVSMSQPSQRSPMAEGTTYRVQCDIVNVAPASYLSVHWHKGNEIFYSQTFDDSISTPVNKSSVVNVTAHRDDSGTKIWCEAKLNFWQTGPNIPAVQSNSHEVSVLYAPTFAEPENEVLELSGGAKIILNCTAAGNPAPEYSWDFPHPIQQTDKNQNWNQPTLIPSFQLIGTYQCTAFNTRGTKTKSFIVEQARRNRTTFAALVGGFGCLAALLLVGGLFFVTPEGTFSFNKSSYLRGQPASSGPV